MASKAETAILEAAFATFANRPTATLADVATAAGVGRATLHRHFKGREELMTALALRAMAELDDAFEAAAKDAPSWTEALRFGLGAMIPLASRTVFLDNEPLDHVPALRAETARQRAEMIDAIKQAQAEGGLASDVPATWIAEAFDGLIYAAWTMVRDEEATPRQAADLAWRTLTNGVGGAK